MMNTQKLLDTYMLVGAGLSRVKYEIFTGDEGSYAFITIYAYEPHFHIKGYDSLKLDGNDSNLLIVFYVQIVPDDFVMQLHRFGERQGLPAQPCQMLSQIQVVSLNSLRISLADNVQFSLQA
ncbi:DNA gyrase subunit beta [Klebsiella pneumoniae]|nr:DNA gyrase subunit beta [Klebsiella pneumoniae]